MLTITKETIKIFRAVDIETNVYLRLANSAKFDALEFHRDGQMMRFSVGPIKCFTGALPFLSIDRRYWKVFAEALRPGDEIRFEVQKPYTDRNMYAIEVVISRKGNLRIFCLGYGFEN